MAFVHYRDDLNKGAYAQEARNPKAGTAVQGAQLSERSENARLVTDPHIIANSKTFTPAEAPSAWAATTVKAVGDRVVVKNVVLEAKVAGTTGSTEPALPVYLGGEVVDGSVTWKRLG